MKLIFTILLATLTLLFVHAQTSGIIQYQETQKLEFELPDGIELDGMMENSITTNRKLLFDKHISVYRDGENNEDSSKEMSSDDGSFKMVFKMGSDTEEIDYLDQKEKIYIQQTSFMDKEFLIEQKIEKSKWKITTERIKYLGYVCQKATMTKTVEKMINDQTETKEVEVVAWFTSEIPASVGPRQYNQLPGAVLMVSVDDGKTEIKATEINLTELSENDLSKPTKGKKVTPEEYKIMMAEKMAEMHEMYNTRGGESIMIRG